MFWALLFSSSYNIWSLVKLENCFLTIQNNWQNCCIYVFVFIVMITGFPLIIICSLANHSMNLFFILVIVVLIPMDFQIISDHLCSRVLLLFIIDDGYQIRRCIVHVSLLQRVVVFLYFSLLCRVGLYGFVCMCACGRTAFIPHQLRKRSELQNHRVDLTMFAGKRTSHECWSLLSAVQGVQ